MTVLIPLHWMVYQPTLYTDQPRADRRSLSHDSRFVVALQEGLRSGETGREVRTLTR